MLLSLGFIQISQNGSHKKMRDKQGKIVIVAQHNKDIPYGTFVAICEQAGISVKDARNILGK